jgi:phenylacetate-CoA ligase
LQRQAIDIVYNRWADWQIGDKIAILWGAPQDLRGYPAFKQKLKNLLVDRAIVLDFFNVTPQTMQGFVGRMARFRPKVIYGYSQAVYLLAQYVAGRLPERIKVKSAICTAEPLYPAQRELIQKTFECEVFDRYASRESGLMATECSEHSGFHLVADSIYLEITSPGGQVKDDQAGDVLVTDLLNYGMPFIRYRIGDLAAWEGKSCSCGLKLPLLKSLVGRDTDFLVTPEGGVISGVAIIALLTQYGTRGGIAQMQILQEAPQELFVKVVKGPRFGPEDILHIKVTLHKLFGSRAEIDFQFVSEIPKEKSGKFRYTISRVQPGFVRR